MAIESHSVDRIPLDERHGSARSLFAVWFAANMQVTTIVTGALGVILGLSLPWAILALVLGNAFGAVFMALHSAQGPKLGIPQMIQSRAQFGFYGAIAPLVVVLLMYLGFYASGVVLGGQALAVATGVEFAPAAIGLSVAITILTIFGYRTIHRLERVVSAVAAIAFTYLTYRLLTIHDVGAVWDFSLPPPGLFLLVVSVAATWQISYAPYVADYSRYLPEETPVRAAFLWTYAGSAVSAAWMMSIGSIAAFASRDTFDSGSSAFLVALAPGGVQWIVSLVIVLGIVAIQVLNLYGMFMASTTTITALRDMRMRRPTRILFIIAASAVGTFVGLLGQGDFIANFENFILFLAYFLIPWTAINLVDFYLIRKERYDLASIFSANGIYGRVNWRTMIAYAISIAAELPFMSTSFYTGPMVGILGGADIAWIVGLVVAAGLYGALTPRGDP